MNFEAEFRERAPFLRALARRLASDQSTADDLVQETYVAALADGDRRSGGLASWLTAVLRNRAARRIRTDARQRARARAVAQPRTSPDTVDIAIKLEVARRLLQHVEALEVPCRDAIFLRYYEDKKPQQIAELRGIPVATVKTRLARALALLRQRLDADEPEGRQEWLGALGAIGGIDARGIRVLTRHAAVARRTPLLGQWLLATGVALTATVAAISLFPAADEAIATPSAGLGHDTRTQRTAVDGQDRRAIAAGSQVVLVHGLVEDAALGTAPGHGRPAANVAVHCKFGSTSEPGLRTCETTSDAQGCFDLELPADAVLVAAEVHGDDMLRAARWTAVKGAAAPTGRLVLTRYPKGLLEGMVIEPSGAAVAGARVAISHWQDGERVAVETSADQNGYFVLRPGDTDAWLTAEREGFLQVGASQLRQRPRGGWEPARILLAPAGTLRIEVEDPMGRPARSVGSLAVGIGPVESGLIEATDCTANWFRVSVPVVQGRATSVVPAGLRLRVLAGQSQFDRERDGEGVAFASAGQPIVVDPGTEHLLRLVIHEIEVQVLDPDAQIAAGAALRLETVHDGRLESILSTAADARGCFRLGLCAADRMRALLVTASRGAQEISAQHWLLAEAAESTPVELRLAPAPRLVGHVRDADGHPVAARIRHAITLPGKSEVIDTGECQNDEDGAFCIRSIAGVVQRLEVRSDRFATEVCEAVSPAVPIEVVLERQKRVRIRLRTASTPAIAELEVGIGYLQAEGGVAAAWPALGAATSWSHAAPLPLSCLRAQRIRRPEGTWRFDWGTTLQLVDGPDGRVGELWLDRSPAILCIRGRTVDGAQLSSLTTGPVTLAGDEVELPVALSPTATCRGRILFADGSEPFAACVALADDAGRLLMLSMLDRGAVWETIVAASSHGHFAMAGVPAGVWELRVGTRAELERGQARVRRRVVIDGEAAEPILVKL